MISYLTLPWQLWHSLCWAALISTAMFKVLSSPSSSDDKITEEHDTENHSSDSMVLAEVPDLIQVSDRWSNDDSSRSSEEESTMVSEEEEEEEHDEPSVQEIVEEQEEEEPEEPQIDLLSRLVDDDAANTQTTQLTEEQKRVVLHLLQMRYNLESFITAELKKLPGYDRCRRKDMARDISLLRHKGKFDEDLLLSMNSLRHYGNAAVHGLHDRLPTYEECTQAVQNYVEQKQKHKARQEQLSTSQ